MLFLILGVILTVALFFLCGICDEGWKRNPKQLFSLVGVLVCLIGFIAKVPANHVGIVYSPIGGTKEQTLSEGMSFKSPLDKIYKISTEVQTTKIENLTTQTKDSQYVTTVLDVKCKVNESNAYMVFKQYRTVKNMCENFVIPTAQRQLELITTKYDVIDILGEGRANVYGDLEKALSEEFAQYGIDFVSVTIVDMDAGEKLEAAIEDEAVAKKAVETAEQNLQKAQKEAEQKIVEAEAEKKVNELLEQSLTDKILQQQWIEKWNGKMPTYYGGDDAGLMFNMNDGE